MSILLWIIIGGLAGWIASIVMKTNAQMGLLANIVVGIIGAFIGGFLFSMLGGSGVNDSNILYSLFVATIGAIILLAIVKAVTGRRGVQS